MNKTTKHLTLVKSMTNPKVSPKTLTPEQQLFKSEADLRELLNDGNVDLRLKKMVKLAMTPEHQTEILKDLDHS